MIRGGAPCVSDAYMGYFERFLVEQRLPDLFLLSASAENDYLGFDEATLAANLSPAIFIADILVEMDHVLRVVGTNESCARLHDEWRRFADTAATLEQFQSGLSVFIDRLAEIPRASDPQSCPRVVVTGDFFTRFSPFFMDGVRDLYAQRGIILKPVDLSDLVSYSTYHEVASAAGDWGMKPGGVAFAKACSRIRQADGKQYMQQWMSYQGARIAEELFRYRFQKTGLLVAASNDVSALFETATEHVSPSIYGEVIPTIGKGLAADREGYDGLIVIGPFNCLPFRISEAILKPLSIQNGMPILTYESDGYPVLPTVLRQVDVHIQQVLERAASKRAVPQNMTDRAADYIKSAAAKIRERPSRAKKSP
jgi:predicted nucleotide-binding protein (sugar kinase/HSP70/actin superfamily)